MRIDPIKGWHAYTAFMDAEQDPRRKAMLDNMRHHLKYECLCDAEIFNTMVPEPDYRFYAGYGNAVYTTMKDVQGFYYSLWDSGSSLVELHIQHCAPADWGVACDGEWFQQMPGKALIADGQTTDGKDPIDPDAHYLSRAQLSWFFPFQEMDGKMLLVGEICYIDEAGSTLMKMDPKDVVTLDEVKAAWPAD